MQHMVDLVPIVRDGLTGAWAGLNVSRETASLIGRYIELLQVWGKRLNLVSARDLAPCICARHVEDSLGLVRYIPPDTKSITDMGSGGGFPAIPIAIVTGCEVNLIESDRRKAAFLQTALARLELRGRVWPERLETSKVAPTMCLTARALAPMSRLLELAFPLLDPGGTALFLKGPTAASEVEEAALGWNMEWGISAGSLATSKIVCVTHLQPRPSIHV